MVDEFLRQNPERRKGLRLSQSGRPVGLGSVRDRIEAAECFLEPIGCTDFMEDF
jgi:hypothetical protein